MGIELRMRHRTYLAELFSGKKGEITKKYILGEDVKFKGNKEKRRWWEWFRKLTSRR